MITADTITDEQIRELRGDSPSLEMNRLIAEALAPVRAGCTRRHHCRSTLAAIYNARAARNVPPIERRCPPGFLCIHEPKCKGAA